MPLIARQNGFAKAKPLNMHNKKLRLEHDPEKWEPVFGKDHAQTKS
jgi:hypothetical protein